MKNLEHLFFHELLEGFVTFGVAFAVLAGLWWLLRERRRRKRRERLRVAVASAIVDEAIDQAGTSGETSTPEWQRFLWLLTFERTLYPKKFEIIGCFTPPGTVSQTSWNVELARCLVRRGYLEESSPPDLFDSVDDWDVQCERFYFRPTVAGVRWWCAERLTEISETPDLQPLVEQFGQRSAGEFISFEDRPIGNTWRKYTVFRAILEGYLELVWHISAPSYAPHCVEVLGVTITPRGAAVAAAMLAPVGE